MVSFENSNITILVVDDTADILRLLSTILESQNYRVRKSLSGQAALKSVQHDPPDLILLDVSMPDLSGYDVCQQLKAFPQTADIPIIFISGLDTAHDKVRAFELGGQDYITKPFHQLEVLARVKNQLLIQQQKKHLQQTEAEVRRLNTSLERQVQIRTLELQQALDLEATLKRISDTVRDTLNESQILRRAVEELAAALQVRCCDATLHNVEHQSSPACYEYVISGVSGPQGDLPYIRDQPEIYEQLQTQRSCFAFCQFQPSPTCNPSAILACPIFDDQVDKVGTLGALWLFRETYSSFGEIEVHLVQQVANQCAIALRQARLYEAAQTQVKELERVNHLKDDFLSTISHELRTPLANMKMMISLLNLRISQQGQLMDGTATALDKTSAITEYLTVLQDECDRELALVEDLLHLQHIEAGTYSSDPVPIRIQDLIPHLIEPFEARTHVQQQTLQVEIDPTLPVLDLDIRSFSRIITELLSNAYKYTPSGETISVSAVQLPDPHPPTQVHYLQIIVTNTGVEIAPEELTRIFDKFYRLPNADPWKHGGTGLGLTLVKSLVEHLGGTICATSAHNQTTFIVQLPILDPKGVERMGNVPCDRC